MKPLELATLIRQRTHTNATTFTNADMLVLVNLFKDEIASKIVEKNNGMFLVPYTFNLIANQREYAIGDDVLNRIHKVEIKFSATESRHPSQYIKDYSGSETESEIANNFNNSQGGFAHTIRRRAILILSGTIIAVTAGVRMWSHVFPADFTDMTANTFGMEVDPSTTTFGFPRQFHELLARKVQIEYKGSQPKPIPLSPQELRYEIDLQTQLDAISTVDNSGEIIADLPNAEDLGNNGYNY